MNPVLSDSADELAGTEKVLSFFREQLLSGALKVGRQAVGREGALPGPSAYRDRC